VSGPADRLAAALADRYRIERELGEGGMATVYLARDLKHDRDVAIKVLKPELAAVVGSERFLAEIRTTANLQHPGILPLHDSGEVDSLLYYVMPYVEGESLRDRLDREQQLPVDEAVKIAGDVAEALAYAHDHGVIHRDVKPANILLAAGRPVISDFGIALAVSADSFLARWALQVTRLWGGDFPGSIAAAQPALVMSGRSPYVLGFLAEAYAAAGQKQHAVAIDAELEARAVVEYVAASFRAAAALATGEVDRALDLLQLAVEQRDGFVLLALRRPLWEPLRAHPRFNEIMAPTGLASTS
jgi:serine/threonine protein kinase